MVQGASNTLTPLEPSRASTPLGGPHGNGVSLYAAATAAAAAAESGPAGTGLRVGMQQLPAAACACIQTQQRAIAPLQGYSGQLIRSTHSSLLFICCLIW